MKLFVRVVIVILDENTMTSVTVRCDELNRNLFQSKTPSSDKFFVGG